MIWISIKRENKVSEVNERQYRYIMWNVQFIYTNLNYLCNMKSPGEFGVNRQKSPGHNQW